jgi:hypothetical protein
VKRLALVNAAEALAGRAAWSTIGNADERVGTDKAVAFAEALKNAAAERAMAPRVTLRVLPTPGHASLPEWHDDAALWIVKVCGRKNSTKPVETCRVLSRPIERFRQASTGLGNNQEDNPNELR